MERVPRLSPVFRFEVREMLNLTDQEFRRIADYVKTNFGIHLSKEKKMLVVGRLSQVLYMLNMRSFSEYMDYIASDTSGEAARLFISRMTTNHTYFMREANHFYYIRDHVLPNLLPTLRKKDLRVWSAGCSTGEEAYTLAMLFDEYLGNERSQWDARILATDISDRVLNFALQGIYSSEAVAPLPPKWRTAYFQPVGGDKFEIVPAIKNEVIFRRFNLMDPFPFRKKFHIIFCRNVMIYFDDNTKNELIDKFYQILEPGGYLFIGHSETINRHDTKLKYVMPSVYRKV